MKLDLTVLIKGAGEMASGVAHVLHQSHLRVLLTETPQPLAVRRAVSFCEAVYQGSKTVEGVEAVLVAGLPEAEAAWATGCLPVLVDPWLTCLALVRPQALVEATLSKTGQGLAKDWAPMVIALGPGFSAGQQAHLVVETNRGHGLGRLIRQGPAQENTSQPGEIAGKTWERVLRAPVDGIFSSDLDLSAMVRQGQEVARVGDRKLIAQTTGLLRGFLRPGTPVRAGQKVGDIDPRGQTDYLHTISEKARALGGAVLTAIMQEFNR